MTLSPSPRRNRIWLFLTVLVLAFRACTTGYTQWSTIAPGLGYREYTLPGPVRAYVARADRQTNTWIIDSMKGKASMKFGKDTIPAMAELYNDSVTFDGHRYDLKVAINGDYHNATTGVPLEGQLIAGWVAKRFGEYSGIGGFVWTSDRRAFQTANVQNGPTLQHVLFADGARMELNQLNEPRGDQALAIYTPQYSTNTATAPDGTEVLVRMSAPLSILPEPPGVKGEIMKIREKSGSSPLPFNHVVLSASGRLAAELLRHARAGQTVYFDLELKDYGKEDIGLPPHDWHNAYASIGGPKPVLVNGKVPRDWEAKAKKYAAQGKKHGSVVQDPRTVVAFNDRYIFFIVVDGRSKESIGMTFTEAGFFCKDVLQATDAVLQDGGGSSTIVVNGKVTNIPSGKGKDEKYGVLRAVSNGYFIAELLPPKKSTQFQVGQAVQLKGEMRLGPGTNFGSAGKPAAADRGTILPEPLSGIFAKATYWWYCRFGDTDGWASLEQLSPVQ